MKVPIAAAVLSLGLLPAPILAAPPTSCTPAQANGKYDFHSLNAIYRACSGTIGPTSSGTKDSAVSLRCLDNQGRISIWEGRITLKGDCRITGSYTGRWASGAPGTTSLVVTGGTLDQSRNSLHLRSYELGSPTPLLYSQILATRTTTVQTFTATAESSKLPVTSGGPPRP